MSTLLWLFFLSLPLSSNTQPWQLEKVTLANLHGMESPTGLQWFNGRMAACADLDEAFPGIYVLKKQTDGFHAQLLKYLPQLDVEDLHVESGSGNLRVIAGRRFSHEEEDWTAQVISLEPRQLRLAEALSFDITPNCFDKSMRCGLVGMVAIDDSTWVAIKKSDVATLVLLEKRNDRWYQKMSASLTLNRRFVTISAVKVWQSKLLFLIKDQWQLAMTPIEGLKTNESGEIRLQTVFDFEAIKPTLNLLDQSLAFKGLAEGFEIDKAGKLWVVLNNRGKEFRGKRGESSSRLPKLVIFEPSNNQN